MTPTTPQSWKAFRLQALKNPLHSPDQDVPREMMAYAGDGWYVGLSANV